MAFKNGMGYVFQTLYIVESFFLCHDKGIDTSSHHLQPYISRNIHIHRDNAYKLSFTI